MAPGCRRTSTPRTRTTCPITARTATRSRASPLFPAAARTGSWSGRSAFDRGAARALDFPPRVRSANGGRSSGEQRAADRPPPGGLDCGGRGRCGRRRGCVRAAAADGRVVFDLEQAGLRAARPAAVAGAGQAEVPVRASAAEGAALGHALDSDRPGRDRSQDGTPGGLGRHERLLHAPVAGRAQACLHRHPFGGRRRVGAPPQQDGPRPGVSPRPDPADDQRGQPNRRPALRVGRGTRLVPVEGIRLLGAVSYALAGAGLLRAPMTSGQFMSYGIPGPGRWLTIYASPTHVYAVIAGLRWDTVGDARGSGPRWHPLDAYPSGFEARHLPGL